MTDFVQKYTSTNGGLTISEDLTGYDHAILSITGKTPQWPGGPTWTWTDSVAIKYVGFAGNLQAAGIGNLVVRKDAPLATESISISNGNVNPIAAILYALHD